jgi:hypothetical protein
LNNENEYEHPDWSNNSDWTEFDWEIAMRKSDAFAAQYFDLLEQYGELPGSDEIILKKLKGNPPPLMDDGDYYIEFDPDDLQDIEEDDEDEDTFDSGIFYENAPSYLLLRQVSIGWCNIYATFLLQEHRKHGVIILFHLGRAMAHLVGALSDGTYEHPSSNIASAKRALDQVNKTIGYVDQLTQMKSSYKKVTGAINKHLTEVQGKIIDHLGVLREKLKKA